MQITKFFGLMNNPKVEWIQNAPSQEEIYDFRPFSETAYKANILHIGYIDRFPLITSDLPLNFLCISNQGDTLSKEHISKNLPNANILILHTDLNYRRVCDLCSDIFIQESIHNQHIFNLLTEYAKGLGLGHLIDSAYAILKSPIIVVDNSYRILGMYHGQEIDNRHDLEEQRATGYLSTHNIERLKRDRIYEQARSLSGPFYSKGPDEQYAWITLMLQISGIEVASLSFMESDHPFTTYDMQYMKLFSDLVVLELQKNDAFSSNGALHKNALLSELLEERIKDKHILNLRMSQLNWILHPYYNILTIFDKKKSLKEQLRLVIRQLNGMMEFEYVLYDYRLVLLIPQTVETAPTLTDSNKLIDFLKINDLFAIVSQRFSNLLELKTYYDQTSELYQQLPRKNKNNPLRYFDDYLFLHMYHILDRHTRIQSFYHPTIIKMIEYDQLHNTQFIETLGVYLQNMDKPKQCAELLFIHKNTLYYRLSKIKELFQLDLSDGSQRLHIHLTLKLLFQSDHDNT